jgi:hypothetical protein
MLVTNLLYSDVFVAQKPSRQSRRGQRGKLRRFQEIDHVVVEEPFSLNDPSNSNSNGERKAGEGCYISATVNNRRYYGVLIDQAALTAASLLHFQDEAGGLDLNRRMRALNEQVEEQGIPLPNGTAAGDKRLASDGLGNENRKRQKSEPTSVASNSALSPETKHSQQVQKFRYIEGTTSSQGYRLLVATYADVDAASEEDPDKAKEIEAACVAGGNFVGRYYYQYEVRLRQVWCMCLSRNILLMSSPIKSMYPGEEHYSGNVGGCRVDRCQRYENVNGIQLIHTQYVASTVVSTIELASRAAKGSWYAKSEKRQ